MINEFQKSFYKETDGLKLKNIPKELSKPFKGSFMFWYRPSQQTPINSDYSLSYESLELCPLNYTFITHDQTGEYFSLSVPIYSANITYPQTIFTVGNETKFISLFFKFLQTF